LKTDLFHSARALMTLAPGLGAVFLASLLLATPPAGAATCPQMNVAIEAGNAFLAAARTEHPADFAAALAKYADMDRVALFALGKYRRALPDARRAEFVALSSRYVANTLAGFALKFRAMSIKPVECQDSLVITSLEFGGGRAAQRAIWRINGGKVVDVDVQQAWLAQLLRDNYVAILDKAGGNINALFAALRAKP